MPSFFDKYPVPKPWVMFVGPAILGTSLIIVICVELAAWPTQNSHIDLGGWGMKIIAWALYLVLFLMAFKGSADANKLLATGMLLGVIMATLGHWAEILPPSVPFPDSLAPLQKMTAPITGRAHVLLVLPAVLLLLGPVTQFQERMD